MPNSLMNIRIDVSPKIFLKDPYSSDLGKSILARSLPLMDDFGMEKFTFKKLACEINSTESAIYRYFENKHKLLLYYVSWYWGWMEYNLAFGTANISDPKQKLEMAITILTRDLGDSTNAPFSIMQLQHVVVSESAKAYLTKDVDDANKDGLYLQFKNLCKRFSELIHEVAPKYPFAHSMASSFIQAHLDQHFFFMHLPSLTDLENDEMRFQFFNEMIFSTLKVWEKKQ